MSDETLTVKKENVLRAAEKCGDAKAVLKELFPDVFKEEKKYWEAKDLSCTIKDNNGGLFIEIHTPDTTFIQPALCNKVEDKIFVPFYMSNGFELCGGNFRIKKL